jgi:hypothetical protein
MFADFETDKKGRAAAGKGAENGASRDGESAQ